RRRRPAPRGDRRLRRPAHLGRRLRGRHGALRYDRPPRRAAPDRPAPGRRTAPGRPHRLRPRRRRPLAHHQPRPPGHHRGRRDAMSADRLRETAKALRELAEAAYTPEALTPYGDKWIGPKPRETWPDQARDYLGGEWGEYVATMHPGVGLALADWLETVGADEWAHGPSCLTPCDECDDDP